MEQNCIVKDCNNISSDMTFYNGICAQCYMYLTKGAGDGQLHRNIIKSLLHRLFNYLKETDERFNETLPEPPSSPVAPVDNVALPSPKLRITEVLPDNSQEVPKRK